MSELDSLLAGAERTPVVGWDFTRLGSRLSFEPPPWDFTRIVAEHAGAAAQLLDMGTGGGEWLSSLPRLPPHTVATEGWSPNVALARARLEPLGVTVVEVEAAPDNVDQRPGETRGRLPFPTGSFELVSNRHESFVAAEVARVLKSGGAFLTQQTGGNTDEFHDALGLPRPRRSGPEWSLELARAQLGEASLEVTDSATGSEAATFADVGALAWYLRAIPWVVEGFSIQTHRRRLERLHRRIVADGPLTLRQPSFWLRAVKPRQSSSMRS